MFAILGDIYSLDARGGEAKAITRGLAVDTQPAFSPDGRWIAFLSDRSGAENLWIMRPDGSDARQVTLRDDDPIFASPAWSADGRLLLVSRYRSDRNAYELWRYPVEGGAGEVVVANRPDGPDGPLMHALGAVASADGEWIYYAAHEGDLDLAEPVEWRIARMPAGGGASRVLVSAVGDIRLGKVQSSAFRPALSHDGHLLAYVRAPGRASTWLRLRDLGSGERAGPGRTRSRTRSKPRTGATLRPHVAFAPDDRIAGFRCAPANLRASNLRPERSPRSPLPRKVEQQLGPLTRAPVRVETGPVSARIVQAPALSPDGRTISPSPRSASSTRCRRAGGAPTAAGGFVCRRNSIPRGRPTDGGSLFVTWTGPAGGQVWETRRIGRQTAPGCLTHRDAFYTHPVYAPDGSVVVIRSPSAERRAHYVEFGQIRDAELVSLKTGRCSQAGRSAGTPHFLADGTLLVNGPDGVHRADDNKLVASAVGPNWYFAEGSAQADDLRVNPDGPRPRSDRAAALI